MGTTFNISTAPVISLDHVHVAWDHDLILHGITASIPQGQCVAVTGPNGAGKSTLMKAILGTAPISSGDIALFGNSIRKRSAIPWQRIGYVPQRASSGGAISSSCIEVVLSGLLGTRKWWHSRGDRAKALEA
ncbi:MAG: ATP-binding cassette domain-containing protein, partial [Actinomyces sp.]|nr:ATP-binding cassette domain-containing protein [Actinomyces sp.]